MNKEKNSGDEERHRCEVREWMRRRTENGKDWLRGILDGIERKRGKPAADRLRSDIAQQWKQGNRGAFGDWR